MPAFCKKCGSPLEPIAIFCDNCGGAVGPAVKSQPLDIEIDYVDASSQQGSSAVHRRPYVMSRKIVYVGGATVVALVVSVAASFFLFGPPPATNATLLPPFKLTFDGKLQRESKSQLCIANLNYGLDKFNAGQNDSSTRKWLDTLVLAGLYSEPVEIQSGGLFQQTLLQYVPAPELAKWRDGNQLCVAKNVQAVEVIEIAKPEERVGSNKMSKTVVVKAKVVAQATDTAAWLEKPEIRDRVLAEVSGWEYKAGKLQKEIPATFALKDGKWVTLAEFKTEEDRQSSATQDATAAVQRVVGSDGKKWFAGLSEKLTAVFGFGGNPLIGVWVAEGEGQSPITITSNAIDFGFSKLECTFQSNSNRISAICNKGELEFEVLGKDRIAAIQQGKQLVLNRVK